jgi:hypothetical protein
LATAGAGRAFNATSSRSRALAWLFPRAAERADEDADTDRPDTSASI